MNRFFVKHVIAPFKGQWGKGFLLLGLWTVAFVALPAISGWFLAICSVVFVTANYAFSYLIPSAIIRLLALFRTATRYFERIENHKTTLNVQQSLQLKIFQSVAKFPYFKKQVNNNSSLLENSTHGVEQVLNHVLLWLLPLSALFLSLILYFGFIAFISPIIAIEFIVSAAILLFIIPQFLFNANRKLYGKLKTLREDNHQSLIQSFRGRIEISKYNLEAKVIMGHEQKRRELDILDNKLQANSFYLQLIAGFGFSCIAVFILWKSGNYGLDAPLSIGVFFGIMAQAELSEMLFSGKSERSSVEHQVRDIGNILKEGELSIVPVTVDEPLRQLRLSNICATIPGTHIKIAPLSLEIERGEWVAIYGETGKGKSTLLNSLFYPEYRDSGSMIWNGNVELSHLPVPESVYVTQKAYLLTGTLRENFEGYPDEAIEDALKAVDLASWRLSLPEGLDTWLGENGETLSGGQRKKLLLAQALLKRPQILVVDEPTAGISSDNAISIFRQVKHRYPSITIIMATHLKDFETVVDKVIRL